jgi:folate-binding protein YgfZ
LWHWLEVQSGIAMITQPIFEAFVPQMLNYESVGGVSFKKGCYPGQEVVARSQFRGTLKRRAYLVHTAGTPTVGQEVFHVLDAEQPCGLVAAVAANPSGGFDALVSMQTAAAADSVDGRLTLGGSTGAALMLLPLPYPLLEDI